MLWGVWAALQPNPKQPDSREKKVKLYWPLLGDFDWLVKWSVTCVMLTPCHTLCPPPGNFNSWRPVTLSLKGKKAMISWCVDVCVVAHALSRTVHILMFTHRNTSLFTSWTSYAVCLKQNNKAFILAAPTNHPSFYSISVCCISASVAPGSATQILTAALTGAVVLKLKNTVICFIRRFEIFKIVLEN